MNKITSKLFSLAKQDWIKGAIMAAGMSILTALVTILQGMIAVPPIYPDMKMLATILVAGIIAGATYILKNLFTNSKDQFMKKEPSPPVQ